VTAETNKQIVRAFYEAGNRGDMDTAMGLLAEDIVWTNIGTTALSGTFCGKAELQEKLLGPLFGRLQAGIRMEIIRLVAEDDIVVAETRGQAATADGQTYNNSYCWIVRIRDGQFAEVTEYLDTALLEAVFGGA
jgi:ketosteroid isomerase-like protein